MKRGDIIAIATTKVNYGEKPRPALVIQSNVFNELESVTVLPITSTIIKSPLLRVSIIPNESNGLKKISQVMIDKIITIPRENSKRNIGIIDDKIIKKIEQNLLVFLGIVK